MAITNVEVVKPIKSGTITTALGELTNGETFTLKGDGSSESGQFTLNNAANTYGTTIKSGAVTSNITFTLPVNTGNNNQVLKTDGNGVLSFVDHNSNEMSGDTSPQLGGPLDVNGNSIVSTSNGNISFLPDGSGKVLLDGDGTNSGAGSGGIIIENGSVDIKNAGAVSNVKFYCESSNAHYTQLQSAPHSSYSGNVTVTLPTTTGTLITTAEAQALITGTETFTATGSITAGQVVALRTDGNVEVVSASNVANWIGVSTQTVTNGNTLKVTILGGINTNLTGLTIGSVYYVQNDATISTSSGSYKIGRAIATTKLYITEGND